MSILSSSSELHSVDALWWMLWKYCCHDTVCVWFVIQTDSFAALFRFQKLTSLVHTDCSCKHAVFVCLSVTFVHSVKTSIHILHILRLFSPSVRHIILVFAYETGRQYSDWTPPQRFHQMQGCIKKSRPISGFISELMQDRAIVTMEGE